MKRNSKRKHGTKTGNGKRPVNQSVQVTVNRTYKNTVFQMIFHRKKELLELYNALNDTDYSDEAELTIVTLENAVYMSMKNDLAFVLDMHLHMYEHQSTHNPNIPLRDLFYVSQEYQTLVDKKTLYGSRPIKIPSPRFVVFYNGTAKQPERQWMKLSDLYELPEENPMLELQVLVLNINQENNERLKEKCRTLKEYMLYIERIRYYTDMEKKSLQEAVETSVEECIREGILVDFLKKNKAEAIAVSIFEYDEEKELRLIRESEREYGIEIGIEQGIEQGIKQGIKKGIEVNISKVMTKLNMSVEQAMDLLDVPEKERNDFRKLFEEESMFESY